MNNEWGEEEDIEKEEEPLTPGQKKEQALGGFAAIFKAKSATAEKAAPPIVTQSPEDKATAQANLKAMLEGRGKASPIADTIATATVTVAPSTISEQPLPPLPNAVIPPPPPPPQLVKQVSQPKPVVSPAESPPSPKTSSVVQNPSKDLNAILAQAMRERRPSIDDDDDEEIEEEAEKAQKATTGNPGPVPKVKLPPRPLPPRDGDLPSPPPPLSGSQPSVTNTVQPPPSELPPPLSPSAATEASENSPPVGPAEKLGLTGNGAKVYNEIISTEKSYLGFISKFDKKLTDQMLATFDSLPTEERGGYDRKKIVKMFDVLQELRSISEKMIAALEKPDLKAANELLKVAAPHFSQFAINFQSIPSKIANQEYAAVFDPLDANALVINAVQRGPRYPLLFKELVKYSSKGSDTHTMATTLLETVQSVADKINEDKRTAEMQEKIHQQNLERLQPLIDLVQKRLNSNDKSPKTQILQELIKQFALQDKANKPLDLKQAVISAYTNLPNMTKEEIDKTLAKTTIPGFNSHERRISLEGAKQVEPAVLAAQAEAQKAAIENRVPLNTVSADTSSTTAADATAASHEPEEAAPSPATPSIDTTGLSDIQQQKLKDFQATLQTNLDKQKEALDKAEAANPSSYLELYKQDMKNSLKQTRDAFENAKVPKDENEAFAQLMEYFFQLLALLFSPATQLVNAGFQKAWNEMKQSYHERQADLQGDKYKDVKHQEERIAKLDGLIEKSNNSLAELKNQQAKDPNNIKFARKIAFEEAKLGLLTEARDKTYANLQTLQQEQSVKLTDAPEEEEESVLQTEVLTSPTVQPVPPPLPPRTDSLKKSTTPSTKFDETQSSHPSNPQQTDIADPLDDLFAKRPAALTPQAQSHAQAQERASVATSSQLTVEELHTKLMENSKDALNNLGIKDFAKITPTQPGAAAHIKLNMFYTADRSENGKTTEVRAEQKPGTEGVTYTMKKDLQPEQKQQTIEQICRLAVETAKPGTEFKVPSTDPVRKAATEAALDKALQAKYPDKHVKGQFKVPDNTPTLANKAR